jgi:DNA primase
MNSELFLLGGLENILGKGTKKARNNYAFHCPFCNHKKKKLEINLETDESGKNFWECWVCKTRGQTVNSLLRQLKVPAEQAHPILAYVKKGEKQIYKVEKSLSLPEEFQPLYTASKTSVTANKARKYLYRRGLTDIDFCRYNIGFCTTGEYEGRIIIPSYDNNNQLNYFTSRTVDGAYHKYKNPEASRDIIFFENMINWDRPIVIVEGPFDALAVRRNAIPILGQSMSKALIRRILLNDLQDIYVALDKDAKKQAISICEEVLSLGKRAYMVDMEDKDPSEMGFEKFTQKVNTTPELTTAGLIKYKLEL